MAAYFWVTGGTGNWNSASNWALTSGGVGGVAVPSSVDSATIDANSGAGSVTLDISPVIQTLTCTGFTGTLAFGTNTISLNSTGTVFTGETSMTVTGTPLIILTNSSATARTITPRTVTEANSISFRITAGTGTLSPSAGSYRNLDFTDGVNPTGYGGALAVGGNIIYGDLKASTNMSVTSGVTALTFSATSGTKTINTAGVTFNRPFTFNGVGGTWQLQDALTSGATRTCTLTAGTLDLNGYTLTTGIISSSNTNTRSIAFGSSGKIVLSYSAVTSTTVFSFNTSTGFTYTGTSRIELTGAPAPPTIRTISGPIASTGGTEANALSIYIMAGTDTISLGTASQYYGTIDFTGFGGDLGANVNPQIFGDFVLSAGMVITGGTNPFDFRATSSTKTITTAGQAIPNPITFNGVGGVWTMQDALTLGSTQTLTLTAGTLDLNGYSLTTGIFSSSNSNTRVLKFAADESIYVTGSNTTVVNTNTATGLTINRQIGFPNEGAVVIDGGGGGFGTTRTITGASVATAIEGTNLLNCFVTSGSDTITFTGSCAYGLIDFSSYDSFTGILTNNAIFVYRYFALTSGMTLTAGANAWTFKATSNSFILTNGKTIDNPITFDGIGGEWGILDALTMGSTRALTLVNGTVKLAAGATSTVGSFVTTGTNQKYLGSTSSGTQATISAASGTNSVSYLTIQDSNATGGATWYALAPSVDAGNNTGWIFIPTPADSNEITMRLRSFTQPRRF